MGNQVIDLRVLDDKYALIFTNTLKPEIVFIEGPTIHANTITVKYNYVKLSECVISPAECEIVDIGESSHQNLTVEPIHSTAVTRDDVSKVFDVKRPFEP